MSKVPREGYVCDRCKKKGHLIKDCPTNSNPNYDPYKGKGVPMTDLWKQGLGINWKNFKENKDVVYRKIIKDSHIYKEYQQNLRPNQKSSAFDSSSFVSEFQVGQQGT
mmetsp:Transcript_10394/g.10405  ORF Transcript_10394/g.10405 Transcript_10394/m.10405 type:complete len:108 (+) Transcript_10394:528-851(+)